MFLEDKMKILIIIFWIVIFCTNAEELQIYKPYTMNDQMKDLKRLSGMDIVSPDGDTLINNFKIPKPYNDEEMRRKLIQVVHLSSNPQHFLDRPNKSFTLEDLGLMNIQVINFYYNWMFVESNYILKVYKDDKNSLIDAAERLDYIVKKITLLPWNRQDLLFKIIMILKNHAKVNNYLMSIEFNNSEDFQKYKNREKEISRFIAFLNKKAETIKK